MATSQISFISDGSTSDKIVIDSDQAALLCSVLKVQAKREVFLFPSLHPIIVAQFSFTTFISFSFFISFTGSRSYYILTWFVLKYKSESEKYNCLGLGIFPAINCWIPGCYQGRASSERGELSQLWQPPRLPTWQVLP